MNAPDQSFNLEQTIAQLIESGARTLAQRAQRAEERAVSAAEEAERELAAKWAGQLKLLRERLPLWAHEYLATPTCEPERTEGCYDYGYRAECAGVALEVPGLAPILLYVTSDRDEVRFAPCPPQLYFDEDAEWWFADYKREIWRTEYALPGETSFPAAVTVAERYAAECWRLHGVAEERNEQPKPLPMPDPALYSIEQVRAALRQGEYAEAQVLALLAVAEHLGGIRKALESER